MVDFLVKIRWGHYDRQHVDASRSLMEPRQNMVKSMAGFLEKPAIHFAMFFDLVINTYIYLGLVSYRLTIKERNGGVGIRW